MEPKIDEQTMEKIEEIRKEWEGNFVEFTDTTEEIIYRYKDAFEWLVKKLLSLKQEGEIKK